MGTISFRRYDFKVAFLDALLAEHGNAAMRMLDLGSGTSKDFAEVLGRYPNVSYTGVEPDARARNIAAHLLREINGVTLVGDWGEELSSRFRGHFDLTVSLSVLEHVKNIESFLATSVAVTKVGGRVVHRYDLGHALHPVSWLERLLVLASTKTSWIVPATIFTSHPRLSEAVSVLKANGLMEIDVAHAQMPNLKAVMNRLDWNDHATAISRAARMISLDKELATVMSDVLSQAELTRLFPTVTIAGIKRG